jgi:hypothetical protein
MSPEYWPAEQQSSEYLHGIFSLFTFILLYSSAAMVPKAGFTALWGAVRLPRGAL